MLEDVIGVPFLREVEAILHSLDIDAKEELQGAHVLDGEFHVETINGMLKQVRAGAGHHNVVHIEEKIDDVVATVEDKE